MIKLMMQKSNTKIVFTHLLDTLFLFPKVTLSLLLRCQFL